MSGFHVDQNQNKHSLVQSKIHKKHNKPKVMYYLQEGQMETWMDDYIEKEEEKPKTAAANQEN